MNLPLAIVYGAIAVVLIVLYLKFFYLDDLSDLYLDLRVSGWGYLAALAMAVATLVALVLFYEVL
jgi:hypothetical protein